jgi:hypothetical protein
MPLPSLYVEGLTQRALRGPQQLNTYKLGLIEAILKEALRLDDGEGCEALRSQIRTALDVAVWEAPAPR